MRDPLFDAVVIGKGPQKFIAVHGWMGDHHLFDTLHPFIDVEAMSVAFPDCRGYGARRHIGGDFTVEEIAADMLRLADHLGWDQFYPLGHSMAGMAAQRLIADAPGRLPTVFLLAPVPAGGARISDERRQLLLRATAEPSVRIDLIDANTGRVQRRQWLEDILEISLAGTRPDVMARYVDSWGCHGFESDVAGAQTPVKLLIGELDPGTPEAVMRQRIGGLFPDCTISVLANLGHYAMRENPRLLWRMVRECLD